MIRLRSYGLTGQQTGFTMIELITIMILVGILAAVAVPRFNSLGTFDARGFADQIEAYLRFAQKSALAQRRTVYISVSSNAATEPVMCLTNTYDATCPTSTDCNNSALTTILRLPATFRPGNGTTLAGVSFCFNTMGSPAAGQSIQIKDNTGSVVRTVTVEAETGYVHSN